MSSVSRTDQRKLTDLSHVGIAVRDAEETAKFLASIWKIGGPERDDVYEPTWDELQIGQLTLGPVCQDRPASAPR